MKLADNVGYLADWAGEASRILDKPRQITQPDTALQIEEGTQCTDQRQRNIVDQCDGWAYNSTVRFSLGIGVDGAAVFLLEFLQHLFLPAVGLSGFLAVDHLFDVTVEDAESRAPAPEKRAYFRCDIFCKQDDRRYGKQKHD